MPPQAAAAPPQPLGARLQALLLSAHFLWFVGHLLTVIQASIFILYSRFDVSGQKNYNKAYYGTFLSYGIILYKAHGTPQISRAYLERVLMDENAHYLILAIVWWSSRPLWVTLIPFVTFSLFHSLTYFRQEIIPQFFASPAGTQFSLSRKLSHAIGTFVSSYQQNALYFVAYLEVWLIMPFIIVSIFGGYASIFTPLMYAHFLKFRYFFSPMTKKALGDLRTRADARIGFNERMPDWVRSAYLRIRDTIIRFGDVEGMMRRQSTSQAGQQRQ
ncbi:hypothetical protein HK102_005311 [Quaeritorhiza haematococci]|nr:hypothetical protein HK102_005311 [Quaeritorhiza haematococci]